MRLLDFHNEGYAQNGKETPLLAQFPKLVPQVSFLAYSPS